MEHKVEEVKLKCGAKGLLIDVPDAPVFCMELWFRAGNSTVQSYSKYEAAHIMEHMALGANKQHSSKSEVDRYISKYGAYSNAWTGNDYLAYIRQCPDFDWERILDQLIVQVTTPKFLEEEFVAEFGNVEEEMKQRSNDKWNEIDHIMEQRFGWKHSETWLQRLELMQKVTNRDIKEHYKRTHGANNVLFFIAGNIKGKRAKIIKYLEGLADLPDTQHFKLSPYPKVSGFKEPVVIKKTDVPNIYFQLQSYASKTDIAINIDAIRLSALNKILTDGDHSRIYGKARKRGLVYSLGCGRSANEDGNYSWSLYCQVGKEKIDELIDLIIAELEDVKRNGLTRDEVEEAVVAMKGSLRMGNQTAGKIMSWTAGWYTSHEEERVYSFDDVDKWYDEVTPESIQELFTNLIKTKKWGAGFLGNVTEAQANKWNKKLAEIFKD